MVEVLVIFGLVGLAFPDASGIVEAGCPFFPAIVMATFLCPVLSSRDYLNLSQAWKLRGVSSKRDPIPPERFLLGLTKAPTPAHHARLRHPQCVRLV